MTEQARPGRRWPLALALALITVGVVVALATSAPSGTGATDVGDAGEAPSPPPPTATPGEPAPIQTPRPRRNCEPTESNPGGTNNYIPDAPARRSLGDGFIITGLVRSAAGCRPLEGVRVQVWLATETGGETDNRASVRTGADGRYRIETAPTVPQFGEPNIHVAYADGRYRIETAPTIPQFGEPNIHVAYDDEAYAPVFIRRVVDLDDDRAVVNLTLRERG